MWPDAGYGDAISAAPPPPPPPLADGTADAVDTVAAADAGEEDDAPAVAPIISAGGGIRADGGASRALPFGSGEGDGDGTGA